LGLSILIFICINFLLLAFIIIETFGLAFIGYVSINPIYGNITMLLFLFFSGIAIYHFKPPIRYGIISGTALIMIVFYLI
jgi:hypothetical protein